MEDSSSTMSIFALAKFLCPIVMFLFPSYASFKALKMNNAKRIQFWLTYWIIFGVFWLVEFWLEILFSRFPFYYELKLAAFIYLQVPQWSACEKIYQKALKPLLKKYDKEIDNYVQIAKKKMYQLVSVVGGAMFNAAKDEMLKKE